MVPMDVPRVALDMISRFLHGKDYSSGDSMLGIALTNIEDTAHCNNMNNVGVTRGGGSFHEFNGAVKEDALNSNLNKTHTKNQFTGGSFYSIISFGLISKRGSSDGVFYIFFFLFMLLLAVIFYCRFHRSNKQFLSRR